MLPYYILILMPMLIGLLRSNGKIRIGIDAPRDKHNVEIVTFFCLLLILLMFRDVTCGVDTDRYAKLFLKIGKLDWKNAMQVTDSEWGYVIVNKLLSLFTSEPQVLLIVTSLAAVLPLMWFYRKEAELPILTMVLFTTVAPFPMYFSGIKQAMAMAFAIPAWYMAKNKKPIWFILVILAAMQFHKSAFILLALYPLYHLRITPKWLYVVVPLMLAVYIFNVPIFSFIARFLREDYGEIRSTGATTTLLLLVVFAVCSFVVPDEKKLEPDVIALRNILLLTIVIQCFAPIHSLVMRMNYYFLVFIPVLIPKIANRSKEKWQTYVLYAVVGMTAFFAVYYLLKAHTGSDILETYPYVPFWE